jgi:hypothetical protein
MTGAPEMAADQATHYESSSRPEPVEIASMNYRWLINSLDKLVRDEPHRVREINGMRARRAVMDAEHAAAEASKAKSPEPELDALHALASELEGF